MLSTHNKSEATATSAVLIIDPLHLSHEDQAILGGFLQGKTNEDFPANKALTSNGITIKLKYKLLYRPCSQRAKDMHYEIVVKQLGEGSFGLVEKAKNVIKLTYLPPLGKTIAYMTPSKHIVKTLQGVILEENVQKEVALINQNEQHAKSIQWSHSWKGKSARFVSQYFPKTTLEALLEEQLRPSKDKKNGIEAVKVLLACMNALRRMHLLYKTIHRDIKPSNILIKKMPFLKAIFIDFGLSCGLETDDHETGVGTPLYASPEVNMREPITLASDLFSFGLTAAEYTGSKIAREQKSIQEIFQFYKKINYRFEDCGSNLNLSASQRQQLIDVLSGLTREKPDDRASIDDVLDGLNRLLLELELTQASPEAVAQVYCAYEAGKVLRQRLDHFASTYQLTNIEQFEHLERTLIDQWIKVADNPAALIKFSTTADIDRFRLMLKKDTFRVEITRVIGKLSSDLKLAKKVCNVTDDLIRSYRYPIDHFLLKEINRLMQRLLKSGKKQRLTFDNMVEFLKKTEKYAEKLQELLPHLQEALAPFKAQLIEAPPFCAEQAELATIRRP